MLSLEKRLVSLQDAALVADQITSVAFVHCPVCYAPIDKGASSEICHLCKSPFDVERMRSRIVHIINDTGIQLRQSRALQEARQERAQALNLEEEGLKEQWSISSRKYTQLQRLPSSAAREKLRELNRRTGYLDRQLEDLNDKAKLIEQLDQLSKRKADLAAELAKLRDTNARLRSAQEERLGRAYTSIADQICLLLRGDLARQDSFINAEQI